MAETKLSADTVRKIDEIHEWMGELMPLLRKAAPLLDSPMAKMASSSPAAAVMSLMQRGPRRG